MTTDYAALKFSKTIAELNDGANSEELIDMLHGLKVEQQRGFIRAVNDQLASKTIGYDSPAFSAALGLFELREITQKMAKHAIQDGGKLLADHLKAGERVHEVDDPQEIVNDRLSSIEMTKERKAFHPIAATIRPIKNLLSRFSSTPMAKKDNPYSAKHTFGLFLPGSETAKDDTAFPQCVVYTAFSVTDEGKDDQLSGDIDAMRYSNDRSQPSNPNTLVFYSISNMSDKSIPKIPLGKELIERIAKAATGEIEEAAVPQLDDVTTYTTLSPMPGFNAWVAEHLNGETADGVMLTDAQKDVMHNHHSVSDSTLRLTTDLETMNDADKAELFNVMENVALVYLSQVTEVKGKFKIVNPVENFHVRSNGAELANIHPYADRSDAGMDNGLGCMANYRYDLDLVQERADAVQTTGHVTATPRMQEKMKQALDELPVGAPTTSGLSGGEQHGRQGDGAELERK